MKIAVVDDEEVFRNQISSEITKFYGRAKANCFLYADGSEILRAMRSGLSYDAVFLDIEMKVTDGMRTASEMRKICRTVPIVFLTSHTEMAIHGYEVAAFRFLAKPVELMKLKETLTDLERHICNGINITLRCEGEDLIVTANSVIYAESSNNQVRFVTAEKTFNVRMKFSDAQKILCETDCDFYPIHRCYHVNLRHIRKFTAVDLQTDNGDVLPIARSAAPSFKEKMFEYLKMNGR